MLETKDKNLILFLQTILNKKIDLITSEDLLKIEMLVLGSKYIDGTPNLIDFEKLSLFENLRIIVINDTVLTNDMLNFIPVTINELRLNKCTFEDNINYYRLSHINNITLHRCYIDDYSKFLQTFPNINRLEVVNPYDENVIDINSISNAGNINLLVLEGCILKNVKLLKNMINCKLVSLFNTAINIGDLNVFNEMQSLKYLILLPKYKENIENYEVHKKVVVRYDLNDFLVDNINEI